MLIEINAYSLGVYVKRNGELIKDNNVAVIGIDTNKVKETVRRTTILSVKGDSLTSKEVEVEKENDIDVFFSKAWDEILFLGGILVLALIAIIFSHFYVMIKHY